MVYIGFGRRRPRGWGGGYGGYGHPRGYGYPRGYGGGGGGGCLRDLLLVETGCCLAEALGCGPQLLLLAPGVGRLLLQRPPASTSRAVGLVRLYQERIASRRTRPCCRMTPSCSAYAIEALETHGTARGIRLTAARLLRCRPGGPTGPDPVPPA
jgi:putative membrane protein insertion efficiency factor